jgi:hypothetical protein
MHEASAESTKMTHEELEWLVRNRAALPKVVLELRRRWPELPSEPGGGAQSLVGIAFTLWRALPLMPLGSALPKQSPNHASDLLYEIITHNRVTYGEEVKCRDWLVGFYLNSAEERIVNVAEIRSVQHPAVEYARRCRDEPQTRHDLPYRDRWENSLQCLRILVEALPPPSADDTQPGNQATHSARA